MSVSGLKKSTVKTPPIVLRTTLANRSRSKSSTKRKRVRQPTTSSSNSSSDDDDDDGDDLPPGVDVHTETGLRNAAARNNLSSTVVKNIIKRVCHNDHVLALVKLKEEELNKSTEAERIERHNAAQQWINASGSAGCAVDADDADSDWNTDVENGDGEDARLDDGNDTDSAGGNSKCSPFKLTRAKARALNKKPLPILPLPPGCVHQPASEIARIIQEDLRSDEDEDDDEEYRPGEDDVVSDDEFTLLASDLESQPQTPASSMCDSLTSPPPRMSRPPSAFSARQPPVDAPASVVRLTSDGQFKIPGSQVESRTVPNDGGLPDGYTIAQQTRSKVSLATTPIEIIEANFQPPDVDAEAMRCSITDEYMQFLTETISDKPISVDEDDADDDEDFQMPCTNTPFADREEMYNRPITQQECNDLFDDLLNHFDSTSMSSHPDLQTLIQQLDDDQPIKALTAAETAAALSEVQTAPPPDATTAMAAAAAVSNPPKESPIVTPLRQPNWKTHVARRLYRHLDTEKPPADYELPAGEGFLDFQLALLEQQQRQHVQLATQSFLQVYGHPGNGFWMFADRFRGFLTELDDQHGNCYTTGDEDVQVYGDEGGAIVNLRPALRLVSDWEAARSKRRSKNVRFVRFLEHHTEEAKRLAAKCQTHFNFFHPLVQAAVLQTRGVFVYAHLLPPVPFRLDRRGHFFNFLPTDDFLIAHLLERFYAQLRNKSGGANVPLNSVCQMIESQMKHWRRGHSLAVYKYVVRRRNAKDGPVNPIKYFFKHNKAPITKHVIHPFSMSDDMRPLIERDRQFLSRLWAEAADEIAAKRHATQRPSSSRSASPPSTPRRHRHQSPSPRQSPLRHSSSFLTPSKLQVVCTNCSHVTDVDSSLLLDTTSGASADDTNNPIRTRTTQTAAGPIIITTIVCAVITERDLRLQLEQQQRQLHRHCADIFARTVGAFVHPVRAERCELDRRHPLLGRLYAALVSLDVYVHLWARLAMSTAAATKPTMADTVEQVATAESGTTAATAPVEAAAAVTSTSNLTSTTTTAAPPTAATPTANAAAIAPTAKKQPAYKTPTAATYKVLLSSPTPAETNERDLQFAQNFLDRIEAIYSTAQANTTAATAADTPSPADRYGQFLRLLTTFDPRTSNASELYAQCEAFFLPDHPELAELFLSFLLPADAARLGRFVDHHIMQSMSHFMEKLMAYFHKQPAQMRKIMAALKELADEPPAQLTAERVRGRIVPLLRGNALLIEWWQQCFAGDAMGGVEAACDYETVSVPKSGAEYFAAPAAADDDAADAYEEIAAVDLVADPPEHPCHIRFMNGHLFYGSKIVLPVQLSFQTVQYSSVVPAAATENATAEPIADAETPAYDSGDDCGSMYECVHEIKRIGDKKLETLFAAPQDVAAEAAAEQSGADAMGEGEGAAAAAEPADKCCNDVLLRAHAVRLNPTLHAGQLRKPNELLEMLKRPAVVAAAAAAVTGNGDRVGSPKKRGANVLIDATSSSSPASSPPKKCKLKRAKQSRNTEKRRRRRSDGERNADKPNRKSRNGASAATTATATPANRTTPAESAPIVDTAPAAIADTVSPTIEDRTAMDESDAQSCNRAGPADDCVAHAEGSKLPANETEGGADTTMDASDEWTRDEDRIMLEQIQCGFATDVELVGTVLRSGRLPKRRVSEIKERFEFLMDIIANL